MDTVGTWWELSRPILINGLISDFCILSFSRDTMIISRVIIRNQEVVRSMAYSKIFKQVKDIDGEGENNT